MWSPTESEFVNPSNEFPIYENLKCIGVSSQNQQGHLGEAVGGRTLNKTNLRASDSARMLMTLSTSFYYPTLFRCGIISSSIITITISITISREQPKRREQRTDKQVFHRAQLSTYIIFGFRVVESNAALPGRAMGNKHWGELFIIQHIRPKRAFILFIPVIIFLMESDEPDFDKGKIHEASQDVNQVMLTVRVYDRF